MFTLTSSYRYYFYACATDMRKGFDGLCGLVHLELGRRPVTGEVFVFVNRQRDKITNVEPFAWLKKVLTLIPDYSIQKLEDLLPGNLILSE